jgi:hypothetical protein
MSVWHRASLKVYADQLGSARIRSDQHLALPLGPVNLFGSARIRLDPVSFVPLGPAICLDQHLALPLGPVNLVGAVRICFGSARIRLDPVSFVPLGSAICLDEHLALPLGPVRSEPLGSVINRISGGRVLGLPLSSGRRKCASSQLVVFCISNWLFLDKLHPITSNLLWT